MKKVLVTGGAGFIGSYIVGDLVARGIHVVVYDNFSSGRDEFLPEPSDRLTVVRADVLDRVALLRAMEGCDFIFHFQANADVRGGSVHTRVDLEQNTIATWNVLDAAREQGIKGLAFASSATVYGEPDVFPTPESCGSLLQTSLYGASKSACEAMIQAYTEYFGIRCFIYRFVSWIGERYTHGIVFDLMKKLRQDPTRLPLFGDGTQCKSYLYVKDGVRGVMLGIERGAAAKNIFNLGHDHFLTVLEVVRIVLDELDLRDVPLEFAGGQRGWLGDSPLVHLDTTRIKALGWQPETSIEEGIRRTVRYLRTRPHLLQTRN